MLAQKKLSLAAGIAISVLYGLASYLRFAHAGGMPTLSFLCVLPAAMGAVPLLFADLDQIKNYLFVFLVPWLTIAAFFLLLFIPGLEGLICLVVIGSPFILFALLGTLIACVIRAIVLHRARRKAAALITMLLPFGDFQDRVLGVLKRRAEQRSLPRLEPVAEGERD